MKQTFTDLANESAAEYDAVQPKFTCGNLRSLPLQTISLGLNPPAII